MKIKIQAYKPLLGFRGVFDANGKTEVFRKVPSGGPKRVLKLYKNAR